MFEILSLKLKVNINNIPPYKNIKKIKSVTK